MLQRNPITPTAILTSRPKIAALKPPATGNIFYSHDGDAQQGIRLAVGKTKKSWVLSKRIGGSVKSIILGEWPDLPNGLAAEAVAKDKLKELNAGTDAVTTKVVTLMDAFDSHLRESTAKPATVATYRLQIANHLDDIFALPIEKVTRDMLLERLKKVSRQKKKSGQPMTSTAQHLATIIKMATARAAMIRDTRDIAHEPHPGPAPVSFRSGAHVRRPSFRKPRVISSLALNVCGGDCRSR